MSNILVEVCCGSVNDVYEAFQAGADRVELNSNLFHGGLTPSVGSLIVAKRITNGMPIMTMVRPRGGGFCYTEAEFASCVEDARQLIRNGSDGLVFGFLHEDGTIDHQRTKILADIAKEAGIECVFHRAIDVAPDWKAVIDSLIEIGVTRVLTSGQRPDVSEKEAIHTVKDMIDYAAGRIQILPGAGITKESVQEIIQTTGAASLHIAAFKDQRDPSVKNNRAIYFGDPMITDEELYQIADREALAEIIQKIR